MKKLFLFLTLSVLSVSLNSCSDDDSSAAALDPAGSSLTMKVDGVTRTYTTVSVSKDVETNGDVFLTVTASQNGSANDAVSFQLYAGDTGIDAINQYSLQFVVNGTTYGAWELDSLNSNVTVNSSNRLQGTFSGTINVFNNDTQQTELRHTITDGSFNIMYN